MKKKEKKMILSDNEKMALGENLKKLVHDSGMSAVDFARHLNVNYDTVMKWFSGHNTGFLKRCLKIADLLGVQPHEIISPGDGRGHLPMEKHEETEYLRGRIDQLERLLGELLKKTK